MVMKESPQSRGNLIKSILKDQPHSFTSRVVYALFSCLTPEELGDLFIETLEDRTPLATELRQHTRKHIGLAVERLGPTPFIPLVEQLFSLLEPFNTQRAILVNSLLFRIIAFFPRNFVQRYFEVMIDSHRYNDRYRACEVSKTIWSQEVEKTLWRKWEELREECCLLALVRFGELKTLTKAFQSIWDAEGISNKTKNLLLKRVAEVDLTPAEYLRDVNPISYLYGVVIAGESLTKDEALELALSARKMNDLGFAIWCLGQLGQWDALLELNSKISRPEIDFEEDAGIWN